MALRLPIRIVALVSGAVLLSAACGGGSSTATSAASPASTSPAVASPAPTVAATVIAPASSPAASAAASPSSATDPTLLIFIDRAYESPASLLDSREPLTIVSCSRPDPLGLKLVANRADGLEVTVDAANGAGTLQFTKRPGQTEPGAKQDAKVSAGKAGTLLLDFQVNRAIVSCG